MKRLITSFIACALVLMGVQAVADLYKSVDIWTAEDVSTSNKATVTVNTQNVPVVTMSAYRLNSVRALLERQRRNRPATTGSPVATWKVNMLKSGDSVGQRDIYRTKEANLPKLSPGLYLLVAKGGAEESWAVANITNLSVISKRSPKKLLTWVCDATTGKPIANARVTIYKLNNNKYDTVTSGTTTNDGTCLITSRSQINEAAVVSYGGNLASVPCECYNDDGKLVSHFQTDRPVYRPGQTVYYKAILRRINGSAYSPVVGAVCDIEVRDSKSNVLDQAKATTSAVGTISGHYEIPSECAVGYYNVIIKLGQEQVYKPFTVEEYRKSEFKVTVKPSASRYLVGDTIRFDVAADYYFGAPLPQATVNYKVHRSNSFYRFGQDSYRGDGSFYSSGTYFPSAGYIAEGTATTDEFGKVSIPVKATSDAPDSSYSIECTIRDAAAREVTQSASVPVYAAGIRIGVATSAKSVPLGSNIPLQLRVVDLEGNPASAEVSIKVEGNVKNPKNGSYNSKVLAQTTVSVPASGKATATLPAKTEGELTIVATAVDSKDHKTYSNTRVWVTALGTKTQTAKQNYPNVSIKLDRQVPYAPGDTVHAKITTNTLNRPILVTAEGLDILGYAVLPAGRSARDWTIKTSGEMFPYISVQATQWVKSNMIVGSGIVSIADNSRKLTVDIEPDKPNYQPGDTATFIVRTKGPDQKPVPAEVAVSVVDSAIYAVKSDSTPDLYNTFWSSRSTRVQTRCVSPRESSGVGGKAHARRAMAYKADMASVKPGSELAAARTRFADTAYWNACVLTDADGTAKLTFEVPGDLTTWKTTARAITADTRAGSGQESSPSSRPIMLRLAVPRLMVVGDKLTLIGTVNNRTDKTRDFDATIFATGVKVEGETTVRVQAKANGQATVQWTILADTLPENGAGSITGQIVAVDAAPEELKGLSDVLVNTFKVVPKGIQHRIATGGQMDRETTATVSLPADRIEPGSTVKITVLPGLAEVVDERLERIINGYWCNDIGPAASILAIFLAAKGTHQTELNEALAALYGHQREDGGWGSWYSQHKDPETTAMVLTTLVRAAASDAPVPRTVINSSARCAVDLFDEENLWERSALLASAAALAGHEKAEAMLKSVHENGTNLSPFALLTLAEAYNKTGHKDWAIQAAGNALKYVVNGSDIAYLSTGEHAGWSATDVETTAQALLVLMQLSMSEDLQPKLAQWLVTSESDHWYSQNDNVLSVVALSAYTRLHPQSSTLGDLEVTVNGVQLGKFSPKGKSIVAIVPTKMLRDGDNTIALKRSESGGVFYAIDARIFRPATEETLKGMRIIRRYEVQDGAGLWNALQGPVKPSKPVRCSVVVWPNDRPDDIRIVEPIPSGFEFVGNDFTCYNSREEVRDGAVIHQIVARGTPVFFRYYLRAESEGTLFALPASAEAVRRPEIRCNSEATTLEVRK